MLYNKHAKCYKRFALCLYSISLFLLARSLLFWLEKNESVSSRPFIILWVKSKEESQYLMTVHYVYTRHSLRLYSVVIWSLIQVWLFCDSMDCCPPGSSVQGIFQARTLEWVAISFSRGSSQLRYWTQVSSITGWLFTLWATTEALVVYVVWI